MRRIRVEGGVPLCGEVRIGGSKNAALPVLFGGIVTGGVCVFQNLPRVSDVLTALEILRALGARIVFHSADEVSVDYRSVTARMPPAAKTSAIRGSTYLLGAMLARFGRAVLCGAGGCNFGTRPIDQHLLGFERLGATVRGDAEESLVIEAPHGLVGCEIPLAMPSVGASANLLLAAVAAKGETVIQNAAAEPHVTALAEFLRCAGAEIEGIGTARLRVKGERPLHGCRFSMIPDMIEAGTYLAAAMATGGRVTVRGVVSEHLLSTLDVLERMGAAVSLEADRVTLRAPSRYRGVEVITGPYPAFPTDMHPQVAALFCIGARAVGRGCVRERVWKQRFRYTNELCRMGARVEIGGECAVFTPAPLFATAVTAPDLRGGAALLVAALATKGVSEIGGAELIARGYEHLGEKLGSLGARLTFPE